MRERVVDRGGVGSTLQGQPADGFKLPVSVARKCVHCDDRFEAEPGDDLKVPLEVRGSVLERLGSPVPITSVVLQGLDRCNEDDCGRGQTACPAHDVEELFHAHV